MNIFFVSSPQDCKLQIAKNLERAKTLFPDVQAIESSTPIAETYAVLSGKTHKSPYFVWIDSDNYLLDEAQSITQFNFPAIMMTRNEYGITYGHGGIKICPLAVKIPTNPLDVSHYLGLKPLNIIGSIHELGQDWLKYRAIFSEMVKLALRHDLHYLEQWKKARPDIWSHVEHLLTSSRIEIVIELIRYREKFKEYYEASVHCDL